MSKKIPLTQGKFAIVDNEDYRYLSIFSWHTTSDGKHIYPVTIIHSSDSLHQNTIMMHQLLVKKPSNARIFHKNKNCLDNRKSNLQIMTLSNGSQKNLKRKNTHSIYKGVSFHLQAKKFYAYITKDGKRIRLGLFNSEKAAGKAYNTAALLLFGDEAYQNKIQ